MVNETQIKRNIFTSLTSSYIAQFCKIGIRFGSKIVLARMLAPESWGIFAEAMLIIMVCGAIRDMGIPLHLVREKGNYYGNVLLIEIFMSILLIVLVQIFSPFSSFLSTDLPDVLQVLSLIIFLEGIAIVPKIFAEKELLIKRIVGCEVMNFACMAVISIYIAYLNYGVWSLVIGQIGGQTVYAVLSWYIFKGEIPIVWEIKHTGNLIRKSGYLFFVWILVVTWEYIDSGIVGSFLSEQEVGFYFMAYFIASMVPYKVVLPSITRVVYPAMVLVKDDREKLIKIHRYSTIALMCVQVPIAAVLFFYADILVKFVLGDTWLTIIPLVRVLSLSPILNPVSTLGVEAVKVLHYDKVILLSSFLRLLILISSGIILTKYYGTIGMAFANLLLFGNIPIAWRVINIYKEKIWEFFKDVVTIYLISFLVFGGFYIMGGINVFHRVAFFVLSCLVVGGLYYMIFGKLFVIFFKSARAGATLKVK